jgi:hypothetical protein
MHFNHESEGAISQSVSIPSGSFENPQNTPFIVFSGVRFGADGNVSRRQSAGGWSVIGSWLKSGSAASFYLSRVVIAGVLDTDAGVGPLQMNADRIYDIQNSATESATVTFNISDDVSGSPVVDSELYDFEIFEN